MGMYSQYGAPLGGFTVLTMALARLSQRLWINSRSSEFKALPCSRRNRIMAPRNMEGALTEKFASQGHGLYQKNPPPKPSCQRSRHQWRMTCFISNWVS